MKVSNRRITKPSHIRQLMTEQINLLRKDTSISTVDRARAIAYLSNVSLTAMRDGELEERIAAIEEHIEKTNSSF